MSSLKTLLETGKSLPDFEFEVVSDELNRSMRDWNRSNHGFSRVLRIKTDCPRRSVASVKIRGELTILMLSARASSEG
jgi:hypothetical protein